MRGEIFRGEGSTRSLPEENGDDGRKMEDTIRGER